MDLFLPTAEDSGFLLAKLLKREEEGVIFRSHIDGREIKITPESSIGIQQNLGSTIMMCFDECLELPAKRERIQSSLELTTRWAKRCKESRTSDQALFGIIQEGEEDLREESLQQLLEIGFDGYAIGGLSVGESNEDMYRVTRHIAPKCHQTVRVI